MGVYIPGIKLPKDEPGAFQVIVMYVGADGKLRAECEGTHEVLPVPPHGRLIDADALTETTDGIWDCNDLYFQPNDKICDPNDCKGCKWRETMDCFRRMVKHAPTIIEAEKGD